MKMSGGSRMAILPNHLLWPCHVGEVLTWDSHDSHPVKQHAPGSTVFQITPDVMKSWVCLRSLGCLTSCMSLPTTHMTLAYMQKHHHFFARNHSHAAPCCTLFPVRMRRVTVFSLHVFSPCRAARPCAASRTRLGPCPCCKAAPGASGKRNGTSARREGAGTGPTGFGPKRQRGGFPKRENQHLIQQETRNTQSLELDVYLDLGIGVIPFGFQPSSFFMSDPHFRGPLPVPTPLAPASALQEASRPVKLEASFHRDRGTKALQYMKNIEELSYPQKTTTTNTTSQIKRNRFESHRTCGTGSLARWTGREPVLPAPVVWKTPFSESIRWPSVWNPNAQARPNNGQVAFPAGRPGSDGSDSVVNGRVPRRNDRLFCHSQPTLGHRPTPNDQLEVPFGRTQTDWTNPLAPLAPLLGAPDGNLEPLEPLELSSSGSSSSGAWPRDAAEGLGPLLGSIGP